MYLLTPIGTFSLHYLVYSLPVTHVPGILRQVELAITCLTPVTTRAANKTCHWLTAGLSRVLQSALQCWCRPVCSLIFLACLLQHWFLFATHLLQIPISFLLESVLFLINRFNCLLWLSCSVMLNVSPVTRLSSLALQLYQFVQYCNSNLCRLSLPMILCNALAILCDVSDLCFLLLLPMSAAVFVVFSQLVCHCQSILMSCGPTSWLNWNHFDHSACSDSIFTCIHCSRIVIT